MGNPFGEDSNSSLDTGSGEVQNDTQAQGTGYNPAFAPLLNDLPQDLHPKVLPHLQNWDKEVTQRFQSVQPWKPFIDGGIEPDTVQAGLNLINMIQENPEQLYKALGDFYHLNQSGNGQGQGQNVEPTEPEDPYQEKFANLEKNNTVLAQHILEMRQKEENARADAELEEELQAATKKYGEIDSDYVIAKVMANPNLSIDQAAAMYKEWYQGLASKLGAKPLIMGGGGGLPANNVDVSKLDSKGTRSLVTQMLEQARQQGR